MKIANQRKRTLDTYQESHLDHCSPESVYWGESNSTLTASSHQSQSIDLEQDQGGWCADKMRRQRKKMEKLLVCYEQQRKCINQLEEYIDQLQRSNNAKDEEINRLQLCRQRNNQATQAGSDIQRQMLNGQQEERSKMMALINGQLKLYDLERHRWQKEIQAKEQEIIDEKQLFEEQIEANHKFYKEKILKIQLKWMNVEKDLTSEVSKLQKINAELEQQIGELTKMLQSHNEFEEILKLRRELSKRQSQVSCSFDRTQADNQFLKDELQKAKAQIKRLKKQNCKLKNDIQSKIFDQEIGHKILSSIEAKRQLSRNKQTSESDSKKKYQTMAQELKKAKKELNEYQKKCENLSFRNMQLQSEINCLNCMFTERKEKQRKWQSLRKEQHQEIENLNRLFKKIDLNIL